MKIRNNVSKLELKNSLLEIVEHNSDGIDYIEERIFKSENILKLNPEDNYIKEQLKVEKYIHFSLLYLEDCYKKELKKLGVVL